MCRLVASTRVDTIERMTLLSPSLRIGRKGRFSYLMGLYGQNYWLLTRLFGPRVLDVGSYRSQGDVGLPLRVDVLERHPFTTGRPERLRTRWETSLRRI